MTDNVELLPCPFCGKDDELQILHIYEGEAYVGCDRCMYDGVHIKRWNTRCYPKEFHEKHKAKKPAFVFLQGRSASFICPTCGTTLLESYRAPYCQCGQLLDWSNNV